MKITCPSCNTSYSVNAASFPGDGRSVRCARCKNVWHAVPYVPDADILPPEHGDSASVPENPASAPSPASAQPAAAQPASAHSTSLEQSSGDQAAARSAPDQAVSIENRAEAETAGARIVDDGTGEGASGEEPGSDLTIEQAADTRARSAAKRARKGPKIRIKNTSRRGLEAFVVGASLAVAISAIHYREDVVRSLPGTAGFYDLVGLPVNLRGLEFANISQQRDFEDGVPVLIVKGEVLNIEGRAMPVPALRFALRGKDGDELYAWTIEPRQRVIEPDTAMNFRTRLASPPRGAEDVLVRFAERGNRIVEYSN